MEDGTEDGKEEASRKRPRNESGDGRMVKMEHQSTQVSMFSFNLQVSGV